MSEPAPAKEKSLQEILEGIKTMEETIAQAEKQRKELEKALSKELSRQQKSEALRKAEGQ